MRSLLASCSKEPPTYHEQGYVFGTLVEISIYGEDEARAKQGVTAVMREFQRLHDELHAWKPSQLSELNTAIAQGKSKAVTPELAAMLQDAAHVSAQSGGLFNPAIGGLIQAWGFQADDFKAVLPDEKEDRIAGEGESADERSGFPRPETPPQALPLCQGREWFGSNRPLPAPPRQAGEGRMLAAATPQ